MIKQFFSNIFSKKTEATKPSEPNFNITQDEPLKTDFEVTELTYEEYAKIVTQERRKATTYINHERRGRSPSPAH